MNSLSLTSILTALTFVSILTFLLSLLSIPWFIRRLPEDYFLLRARKNNNTLSFNQIPHFLLKNIIGSLLLAAGLAMLFLPGQGILTIILALLLLSYPGKNRLIKTIVTRKKIQKSLDWIRKKEGKKPFHWPE